MEVLNCSQWNSKQLEVPQFKTISIANGIITSVERIKDNLCFDLYKEYPGLRAEIFKIINFSHDLIRLSIELSTSNNIIGCGMISINDILITDKKYTDILSERIHRAINNVKI